ncbi:PGF-pre-PGF domain-containing protein [Halolamina sp. CBA1230]|uniref:PGF-pre-PGF domain-containing protein n=1 Tax=Halolamina sp. CBA1230 TaxID=1853690 RepID=UPI0009A2148A|nr:PGF-pre-PGF domain-containing protein [Halolamina sp. CBA1230]QKY19147.1 PGF-pre-PGF domain-containing protein [Halolamina sp. CBA1230]
MNRRTLTLVVALVLAGTLTFPSAAAPLFDGPVDSLGSDVSLAPSSDYTYLDADDELVVDLSASNPHLDGEGVNPDSRTTIDDVFRVQYNGSQYAHVWLTHGSDTVTFAVDGEPIQSQATNVTLAPNESVSVSMTVDTTDGVDGGLVDGITVHSRVAEPEPEATVEETGEFGAATQSVAPTEGSRRFTALSTEPGQPVEFGAAPLELDRVGEATLTFDGLSATSPNRSFSVTADTTGTGAARSLVVDAGAEPLGAVRMTVTEGNVSRATMRFSVSESYFESRGVDLANLTVYRHSDGELSQLPVTATGERDGRLTFEAETPGFSTFVVAAQRPRLELADTIVEPTTVAPGEAVAVNATVANTGTAAGERTVAVAVDGTVVAERTVRVQAGENETVSVPVVRNETGEYAVSVDDTDAGTFSVAAESTATPASNDDTPSTDRATETPIGEASGFGLRPLAGLLGLLIAVAATLMLARRTPRP